MENTNKTSNDFSYDRYLGYARTTAIPIGKSLMTQGTKYSRYLAYTSELGEAGRPVLNSGVVKTLYCISWGYVSYDVWNHRQQYYNEGKRDWDLEKAAGKRFMFQTISSIIIPSIAVHQTVHFASKGFKMAKNKNILTDPMWCRWTPTIIGLSIIPTLPWLFDEPLERFFE